MILNWRRSHISEPNYTQRKFPNKKFKVEVPTERENRKPIWQLEKPNRESNSEAELEEKFGGTVATIFGSLIGTTQSEYTLGSQIGRGVLMSRRKRHSETNVEQKIRILCSTYAATKSEGEVEGPIRKTISNAARNPVISSWNTMHHLFTPLILPPHVFQSHRFALSV